MQAIRVHPPHCPAEIPYSASNPAPASALRLDTIPIPTLEKPGQLLIRVHATTVTRGELAWPETYRTDLPVLGYDLAGTVMTIHDHSETDKKEAGSGFKPGDQVFGTVDLSKGATWAEYVVAWTDHVALKPEALGWAESASVPISALTAWQALFVKAGVTPPDFSSIAQGGSRRKNDGQGAKRVAVTGAAGAVGTYIVQLAALAGLHVVAVSRSRPRDEDFLKSLGAKEVLQYEVLEQMMDQYDIIIDTIGGEILERCWLTVKHDGVLISVESASADFVSRHRQLPFAKDKAGVEALFFIFEPSRKQLEELAVALQLGLVKVFVAEEFPLREARTACEVANGPRLQHRGKVVLRL